MNEFNKACNEILEILKYLPEEDYKKIPQEEIDFFTQNKDNNYNFSFNENLSFEEQAILQETKAIIVKLYKDYFCSTEQKSTLDEILDINNEVNGNNQENRDNNKIFQDKPNKNQINNISVVKENELQIYKRKWYEIIFSIFYKRKN